MGAPPAGRLRRMPRSALRLAVVLFAAAAASTLAQAPAYRTLNDTFDPPRVTSLEAWQPRAEYLRQHIRSSAGLLPMPERTPLAAEIFGTKTRDGYTVSKVYFESLPGFFITGNLYRPAGAGPFPAVLTPHGHWAYGRLENTTLNSVPGRAINLARQGFVTFTYDMVGYGDSQQVPHTFGGRREALWGLSLAGLQVWNALRAMDFLESLPDVRRDAIGVTGESGGGTQTFLLAAIDPRAAVVAPVNMISLHMQGGCLCENPPGLRLDTTNVEIAATIAPRPLLMVSATGDWTKNTLEREFPAVREVYSLFGAPEKVHAVRVDAAHNYNRESREAMYAWMARWLKGAPAGTVVAERNFTPEPPADLLVFHQRPLPPGAVDAAGLTAYWVAAARRQLDTAGAGVRLEALRHALGFAHEAPARPGGPAGDAKAVVLAGADEATAQAVRAAGFATTAVAFTAFDPAAAAGVRHFETYNRTAAARRVADIVAALRANPGAALVASGDAALAGLLAAAVEPPRVAVLDVDGFDTSADEAYEERLFIPGLRRAGDLQTAADALPGRLVVHDARRAFALSGADVRNDALPPAAIVSLLRERAPGTARTAPAR